MVEAKARRGNDDLDDVFVATGRTARDRAWGVIFGIGAFSVSNHVYHFFFFCVQFVFLPRAFEIG